MSLIAREEEVRILENLYHSGKPEFLALYGRRRVGKTYLIRKFFENKEAVFFNATGSKNGKMAEQITHFTDQISHVFYDGVSLQPQQTWDKTFRLLTTIIQKQTSDKPIILFLDEIPWLATRNSRLLQALDYYWNQHWSNDKRVKLIICGSSAAWIIHKIINNRGGLHNRITQKIGLEPLTLAQTKIFLERMGVHLNHRQIAQLYMVMGGIPYYLSHIERGLSAAQVIERLAFAKKSFLLGEFDNLFASLFDDSESYIKIVRTLSDSPNGMGERTLLEKLGPHYVGGTGHKKLRDLEETGFIMSFKPLFHKKKGTYYRLIDEYTLFYLRWLEPIKHALQRESMDHGNWQAIQHTPEWHSWLGYAFETLCHKHISIIKSALHLKTLAFPGSWRYVPKKGSLQRGAQIDLLFDRQDDSITLCEVKYSDEPFVLTKEYVEALKRKIAVFKEQTRTRKQLFLAMITSSGLKNNFYSDDLVTGTVTLDDFFKGS